MASTNLSLSLSLSLFPFFSDQMVRGFLGTKKHLVTAQHNENETNILGSSMVSQDYIIDKLRDLKSNRQVVRLEIEDMVSSQSHSFMLPMVHSLVVLDERSWEQLKFTDFIDIKKYGYYHQVKDEMFQNYRTMRVCSGDHLLDLISFEASIDIEKGDEVPQVLNLLREMKQDQTISEFVFPENVDCHESEVAEKMLVSKRFTIKAIFNGNVRAKESNAASIGRSFDASIARLGEQSSGGPPDMQLLRSATLPTPKASPSRMPLRRTFSHSARRPTLNGRQKSLHTIRPDQKRAPLRRQMSCVIHNHRRNEACSTDCPQSSESKASTTDPQAQVIQSNRTVVRGRSFSMTANDHSRFIPVQHVVRPRRKSAPFVALAAASLQEQHSTPCNHPKEACSEKSQFALITGCKAIEKPDYDWETGSYSGDEALVAAKSA